MRKLFCHIVILLFITLLSACGGGGGGGGGGNGRTPASSVKAVIKPSARSVEQNIAGIQLSISVPAGVSPFVTSQGETDSAATVEILSSVPATHTLPGISYTPATPATTGRITIVGVVVDGFGLNDQIMIHLKVADGADPHEKDFELLSFEAYDTSGAKVFDLNATGNTVTLSPTLTTTIQ